VSGPMANRGLSRKLIALFAKGELSATTVHDIAVSAWEDGWGRNDPLARKLVRAGSDGTNRSHMANDIIAAAEAEGLVCSRAKSYEVEISTGGTVAMFLPHEFYTDLISSSNLEDWVFSDEELAMGIGLSGQLIEWARDPDVNLQAPLKSVGVMGLHCDGVQYNASVRAGAAKSLLVAAVNMVSAPSVRNRHKRQPLFLLRKDRLCRCGCQGFHTMQELMDVVAWSMRCLAQGVSPAARHDGSAWTEHDQQARMASGLEIPPAALLQVRGDWEGLQQLFNLRSVNSDLFCWMCDATKTTAGPSHYADFRAEAAHRNTLIDHIRYIEECARQRTQPSHLFKSPGLKLRHLTVDVMHSGDLGTFQDAIGSLLWIEITTKSWHRSKKDGLASLNRDLDLFYAAHQSDGLSKLTPLALSQILSKNPGYPNLKAKAAQTRHIISFCVTLAHLHRTGSADRPAFRFRDSHRLAGRSAEHSQLLVDMFEGLQEFVRACSTEPFAKDPCLQGMYKYLQSLKSLNTLWREGAPAARHSKLPFHLRPKCHACQHLVEDKIDIFGSPSSFWCYRDEDFVGLVKAIARKTAHPATLEKRVMQKLRILACLLEGLWL